MAIASFTLISVKTLGSGEGRGSIGRAFDTNYLLFIGLLNVLEQAFEQKHSARLKCTGFVLPPNSPAPSPSDVA